MLASLSNHYYQCAFNVHSRPRDGHKVRHRSPRRLAIEAKAFARRRWRSNQLGRRLHFDEGHSAWLDDFSPGPLPYCRLPPWTCGEAARTLICTMPKAERYGSESVRATPAYGCRLSRKKEHLRPHVVSLGGSSIGGSVALCEHDLCQVIVSALARDLISEGLEKFNKLRAAMLNCPQCHASFAILQKLYEHFDALISGRQQVGHHD